MLERLEGSFESQKRFIQDASHELRTPIAIAQTNIEVLEMDGQASAADYRHLMDVIKLSLERMTAVGDGLLLLSEGVLAKSRWARVDLGVLLKEAASETEARARANGLSLALMHLPPGLIALGDFIRLKQAVINLIDNAIKYNKPGGSVALAARRENDRLVIEVRDTGIGIAPEDLPRVFDRFYRVDKSRSRAAGGSGLGLAIVKKVAEDHGGEGTVDSLPGQGSVFRSAAVSSAETSVPA